MFISSINKNLSLNSPFLYYTLFIIVLLVAVILPRLAAIGYYLYLDEGYHAFMASYINQSYLSGNGFPKEMTGYKLYPYLVFWTWKLPGNSLIWIRLIDLIFAVGMGYVFSRMLIAESKNKWAGLLIAFSFLIGLNYAGAIQNGFKNSFFPAFLCLCWAVYLVRDADNRSKRWYWAGALTGIAILFRETFVLFPLIGVCSLLCAKKYKSCLYFIMGGITAAVIITAISILLRNQFWKIFEFYFVYGKIYGPEGIKRISKFIQNGCKALILYSPLIILTFITLIPQYKNFFKFKRGRYCFWFACMLAPIIEPYLKIGFLYHFSACLPGMAGLCALGYSQIPKNSIKLNKICNYALLLCAVIMFPYTFLQYKKFPVTWETINNYPAKDWPNSLTLNDTTLMAAKKIHSYLPKGGKVSSTGFAYFIFPASHTFPPSISLGDLSRTYIYSDYNEEKFNKELKKSPPDIVLLAKTIEDHSETFYPILKNIFNNNPEYKFIDSIEPDNSKNYGWLGYDIYKRISK